MKDLRDLEDSAESQRPALPLPQRSCQGLQGHLTYKKMRVQCLPKTTPALARKHARTKTPAKKSARGHPGYRTVEYDPLIKSQLARHNQH